MACSAFAQSASPGLQLSDEERLFLEKHGPVVFVSQTRYPPFEFVDDSGERQGLMVELARWIATEAGFHAVFTDTHFKDAQQRVLTGRADVLTSLFYSQTRDEAFDFTRIIADVPATLFVKIDRHDIVLIEHLNGKRIAMQRGDYAAEFLKTKGIDYTLVPVDDFPSAANAVIAGEADVLIGDRQIVLFHLYQNNLHPFLKKTGEPLYVGRNAMAVRDGDTLLQSILNKGITHAVQTGTMDRLEAKWLGTSLPDADPLWRFVLPALLLIGTLLLIVAVWNYYLRRSVRIRTEALSASEHRLLNILQGTQAGTWEVDLQSGSIQINDFWAEMLGYRLAELSPFDNVRREQLIHPEDLPLAQQLLNAHLAGELAIYSNELRYRHRLGHWIWVLERARVSKRTEQEQPAALSGTLLDISINKQHEEELQLISSVFKATQEGITITDTDGTIITVNDAFTRITGYTRAEIIGQNPRILKSSKQDEAFYKGMWTNLKRAGTWTGEIWSRRKNGSLYPSLLTISSVQGSSGKITHYVGVFSDITDQKGYEERLEKMAYYDELTSLPNRALLVDRLQQALNRAKRQGKCVVVAYIDLDGFKEINDTFGHEAGDQVLAETARRLSRSMRDEDTVSRLAGDEFMVVLSDCNDDCQLHQIMTRLIERIAEPIVLADNLIVQVSGSIGIVQQPPAENLEPELLIRQADQAMYQAKQAGRNRYHLFDAQGELAVAGRHQLIEHIRRGLQNNEFVLYYQPKVNMRSGEIVGVEALVRWVQPNGEVWPPSEFLPSMQGHFVAVEFGRWVLETAARQAAHWVRAGRDLSVSVNIDALHLQQTDFVSHLELIMTKHPEIQDHRLELEILETSALEDIEHAVNVINACKRIGVDVALDDFGTGYSSLSYLRRLPFNTLKVDQCFVRDMLDNFDDLAILQTIIGLSESFRLIVLAEGVESIEHGTTLLALGCEHAQGYAIGRPMAEDQLLAWMDGWSPDPTWSAQRRLPRNHLNGLRALVEFRACYQNTIANPLAICAGHGCSDCIHAHWLKRLPEQDSSPQNKPVINALLAQHSTYEQHRNDFLTLSANIAPSEQLTQAGMQLEADFKQQLHTLKRYLGLRA